MSSLKDYTITWEIDRHCKDNRSLWEVLSELLRIFEQIEKENEEKKRVSEEDEK